MMAGSLVLGVNIAAGTAYLALVEAPDKPMLAEPEKMALSNALTDATRLKDFGDRFAQEVRRLGVQLVAVAHPRPRPSRGWKYDEAFERVAMEVTMMLSLKAAGIEYLSAQQHKAAKAAGVSEPAEAANELARRLSAKPKYWDKRSIALMVALAAAGAVT
jgi:hypothetical protein